MITRREFAALGTTGLAGLLLPRGLRSATATGAPGASTAWPGYDRAIVIDCLATPGPFNVPTMFDAPFSDAMIANALASGITAVNVTVSGGGALATTAFEKTVSTLAFLEREVAAHASAFVGIRTVADIRRAKSERKIGLIAGFQDTTMLDGDLSRVDLFGNLGVKIIQLTYNVRTLVGDGCLEPADAGLSNFGRQVVARMNERGILVDTSHCGQRTTLDAIAASTKPVAATHSGCKSINDVPRSKTDEQIRKLADKGGVIGIYMMPFLRARGQPMASDLIAHIEHALKVGGEDAVGIGSDLSTTPLDLTPDFRRMHVEFVRLRRRQGISAPGEDEQIYNYVADLNVPRRLERIGDALSSRGHGSARIEKILGGNWMRVFDATWG